MFDWVPDVDNANHSINTNAAGTQIFTLSVVTGASKESGTWKSLTTATVLTFPTGFTYIVANYEWVPTSGPSTDPANNVWMPTPTPWPRSPLYPVPSDDKRGVHWGMGTTCITMSPDQLSWFTSVYSDQVPLQECTVTYDGPIYDRPPIALQHMSLVAQASRAAESTETSPTSTQMRALKTLGLLPGLSTTTSLDHDQDSTLLTIGEGRHTSSTNGRPYFASTSQTSGQSISVISESDYAHTSHHSASSSAVNGPSTHAGRPSPTPISYGATITSAGATAPTLLSSVYTIGSQTSPPGESALRVVDSTLSQASSTSGFVVNGHTGSISRQQQTTASLDTAESTVTTRASIKYHQSDSQTLETNGPALTAPHSVSSPASSGSTTVVTSQDPSMAASSLKNPVTVHGLPSVSIESGHVFVGGKTLVMGSTLTLGTGTIVTQVALGTNSAGRTVLLGDSTTKGSNTIGVGAHILSGLQGPSSAAGANSSVTTPYGPPESTPAVQLISQATSSLSLPLLQNRMVLLGLAFLLCT